VNDNTDKLLQQALELKENGNSDQAIAAYNRIISMRPDWSVPHYNLGLLYKYECDWQLSFFHNKKATELSPDHEAGWWNLGIAATALQDWRTARQAWNHFGLNLEITDDEPNLNLSKAPVRLDPEGDAEVVWCTRIDPARAVIDNIPLPGSGHRYGDIILNDGAAVGHRINSGKEYPVFNELQLLKKSNYSTYSITAYTNDQLNIEKLIELCVGSDVEVEDWSTLCILCKQCSEGTPHDLHDHDLKDSTDDERYIGFASVAKDTLQKVLNNWRAISLCEHSEIKLELK